MGKTKFSKPSKPLTQEHVGQQYGKLVVQEEVFRLRKSGNQLRWWICLCDCGATITAEAYKVKTGHTSSCGCLWTESITTHHMSKNTPTAVPEYGVWISLKQRVTNSNNEAFKNYGGRGLEIDPRWQQSFETFYADMGQRPHEGLTVERRNNDVGYFPDNCYWAPRKIQNRNKRNNRMLTLDSETMCMADWAEKTGLAYHVISSRIHQGWSDERTLTTPKHPTKGRPHKIKE